MGRLRYRNHMSIEAVEREFGNLGAFEILFVAEIPTRR